MLSLIAPTSVSVIGTPSWIDRDITLFDSLPAELRDIILSYDTSSRAIASRQPALLEMEQIIADKTFLEENLFCSIPDPSAWREEPHPDRAYCRRYEDATGFGYDDLDYNSLFLAVPASPTWGERVHLLGSAAICFIVSARYQKLGFENAQAKGKEAALYTLDDVWYCYHFLYPVIATQYLSLCAQELGVKMGSYVDIDLLYKEVRAAILAF